MGDPCPAHVLSQGPGPEARGTIQVTLALEPEPQEGVLVPLSAATLRGRPGNARVTGMCVLSNKQPGIPGPGPETLAPENRLPRGLGGGRVTPDSVPSQLASTRIETQPSWKRSRCTWANGIGDEERRPPTARQMRLNTEPRQSQCEGHGNEAPGRRVFSFHPGSEGHDRNDKKTETGPEEEVRVSRPPAFRAGAIGAA